MRRYLLDTNVPIHIVNRAAGYRHLVNRIAKLDPRQIGLSAISAVEIYRKLAAARATPENVRRLAVHFASYQVFPFSKKAARMFVELEAATAGQKLPEWDLMIAAHALAI